MTQFLNHYVDEWLGESSKEKTHKVDDLSDRQTQSKEKRVRFKTDRLNIGVTNKTSYT